MRIVFIGAVEFSRRILEQLILLGADVVGVCTLENSKFNADHCDLSNLAIKHGISYRYVDDINNDDTLTWIEKKKPDIIFCFGWSRLLKKKLLTISPMGVLGYHPAKLPANRGRHPLIWALVLGLSKTASTFFFMNECADSGDIISQYDIDITVDDDASTLYEKMTKTALIQINDFMPKLCSGNYLVKKQDNRKANIWRKRDSNDGMIDWRMSANSIYNLTRALTRPYVGAHILYGTQEIKIWRASVVQDVPNNSEPGRVIKYHRLCPVVKCGDRGVCLIECEPIFMPNIGEYV